MHSLLERRVVLSYFILSYLNVYLHYWFLSSVESRLCVPLCTILVLKADNIDLYLFALSQVRNIYTYSRKESMNYFGRCWNTVGTMTDTCYRLAVNLANSLLQNLKIVKKKLTGCKQATLRKKEFGFASQFPKLHENYDYVYGCLCIHNIQGRVSTLCDSPTVRWEKTI